MKETMWDKAKLDIMEMKYWLKGKGWL